MNKDIRKAVLAYDGSKNCEKALKWLLNFALGTHIQTVIVSVIDSSIEPSLGALVQESSEFYRRWLETSMEKAAANFSDRYLPVKTVILEGELVFKLSGYAAKEKADMIVCGSKGFNGSELLLVGSTAQKLIIQSPLPVIVVK